MDENTKKLQKEIAKDKIQVILSGIAVAVLIVMELYVMINFKSNFMFMAVGILLMIVALFFLISAILDISLKAKDIEEKKYEEIYNAQKASYLVIKKSFDEMDQRLRNIEENSSLPAEDIINAQKAVANVTISRSKENTDALMNSNDEVINQLFSIKEKLEANNSQILEKQQTLLKETNLDIQQKIAQLTSQISNIEGKIQNGIPVMAQPIQMAPPVYEAPPVAPAPQPIPEPMPEISPEPAPEPVAEAMPEEIAIEAVSEESAIPEVAEAPVEDLGIDIDMPVTEETEQPIEDLGLDLDLPVEEEPLPEEPVEDLGIDLDSATEEVGEKLSLEAPAEEISVDDIALEEAPAEEAPTEDLGIDIDISTEEPVAEEVLEALAEEPAVEEVAEAPAEEPAVEEVAEAPAEEPAVEEAVESPAEEIIVEEAVAEAEPEAIELPNEEPAEEIILDNEPVDPGADLDALLDEIGEEPEEEQPPEPPAEPEPAEPESDEIVIPDVGVDLTDPNRVMSAEEIEKLFASI